MNEGLKGQSLVGEVLREWECIVNRVAKSEVGEKMIVCGKLQKEVKGRKKTDIWNDVVENVNTDYEGSRKEFWAFVGTRSKGKKKTISSFRSDKGVSVTSTRGKLHVLQKKDLGRMSEGSDFDNEWREQMLKLKYVHVCVAVHCVKMSI